MLRLTWPGDVIQVVIPLLAAAIALAWPMWQQYQRRPTFTRLVRAELLEAGPNPTRRSNEASWTEHSTSASYTETTALGTGTSQPRPRWPRRRS